MCVCLRILASSRISRYDLGRQTPHFWGGSITEAHGEALEKWSRAAPMCFRQPAVDRGVTHDRQRPDHGGHGRAGGATPRGRRKQGREPGSLIGGAMQHSRRCAVKRVWIRFKNYTVQINSNSSKFWPTKKRAFPFSKNWNKIWSWRVWREEQLSPWDILHIQILFWMKILRNSTVWIWIEFDRISSWNLQIGWNLDRRLINAPGD
jgi:hypothetical protein